MFAHILAEGSADFQDGALGARFRLQDAGTLHLDLDAEASFIHFAPANISFKVEEAPLKVRTPCTACTPRLTSAASCFYY